MNWHAEVLRQGGCNDRGRCSFGPGGLSVQRCLERDRNGGIQICHAFSPTGPNSRSHMRQHVLAATRRFRHSLLRCCGFPIRVNRQLRELTEGQQRPNRRGQAFTVVGSAKCRSIAPHGTFFSHDGRVAQGWPVGLLSEPRKEGGKKWPRLLHCIMQTASSPSSGSRTRLPVLLPRPKSLPPGDGVC